MNTKHALFFFVGMLICISQPAKSADLLVEHNGARVFSVNQNGILFFPLSVRELSTTPVVSQGCIFSRSNVNMLWTTDPDRINIKGRFIEPVTDTANWIMMRNNTTGKRAAVTDEGDIPLEGGEPNQTMDDLYIDNHIIQKDISNGTTVEYCNFSDGRIEYPVVSNVLQEDRYYYVKDHLGSTRIVEKNDGATAEFVAYDGYGAIIRSSVTGADHAAKDKFTGKEFDTSGMIPGGVACGLRLTYFGARYYDPDVGVWTSTDAADQFWNPYSYTGGNPIMLTDPNGDFAGGVMVAMEIGAFYGTMIGLTVGGIVGGVYAQTHPELGYSWWAGAWGGMALGGCLGGLAGIGIAALPYAAGAIGDVFTKFTLGLTPGGSFAFDYFKKFPEDMARYSEDANNMLKNDMAFKEGYETAKGLLQDGSIKRWDSDDPTEPTVKTVVADKVGYDPFPATESDKGTITLGYVSIEDGIPVQETRDPYENAQNSVHENSHWQDLLKVYKKYGVRTTQAYTAWGDPMSMTKSEIKAYDKSIKFHRAFLRAIKSMLK